VSNYVLINRGNFHVKLLRLFRDISVFVVGSFILPHPVDGITLTRLSYYSYHVLFRPQTKVHCPGSCFNFGQFTIFFINYKPRSFVYGYEWQCTCWGL